MKIPLVDLISQYNTIKDEIDQAIHDYVVIGAGSMVSKNIIWPGIYAGNPARKLRDTAQ